jgi:hypothetical protein
MLPYNFFTPHGLTDSYHLCAINNSADPGIGKLSVQLLCPHTHKKASCKDRRRLVFQL